MVILIKKNKKIGAYCRVSSREQVQGYSIDNQKEKIQMYLELFDYEPEKLTFYVDEVTCIVIKKTCYAKYVE